MVNWDFENVTNLMTVVISYYKTPDKIKAAVAREEK